MFAAASTSAAESARRARDRSRSCLASSWHSSSGSCDWLQLARACGHSCRAALRPASSSSSPLSTLSGSRAGGCLPERAVTLELGDLAARVRDEFFVHALFVRCVAPFDLASSSCEAGALVSCPLSLCLVGVSSIQEYCGGVLCTTWSNVLAWHLGNDILHDNPITGLAMCAHHVLCSFDAYITPFLNQHE